MPQVIVIAGANGAGKSTVAPFLLRDKLEIYEFVNADVLAQGLSAFSPETVAVSAGKIMLGRLNNLLKIKKILPLKQLFPQKVSFHVCKNCEKTVMNLHLYFYGWLILN